MSADQDSPVSQACFERAACGLQPAITMQPLVQGEAGRPLGIVIAEVVCEEDEENGLFAGLGAFVRAQLPADRAAVEIALERLLGELCRKGRKFNAGAIVSTHIKLLRGTHADGRKLLKLIATGTAVALPSPDPSSVHV